MSPDLDPAIEAEAYAAAGRALVPYVDDEDPDYFEYHHCEDQPNCSTVKYREPCACAGSPWPSVAVQVAIYAAVAAAAPLIRAQERAAVAGELEAFAQALAVTGEAVFAADIRVAVRRIAPEADHNAGQEEPHPHRWMRAIGGKGRVHRAEARQRQCAACGLWETEFNTSMPCEDAAPIRDHITPEPTPKEKP